MTLSDEARLRVSELAERRLSPEEFDAWVNAPMSDEEREEILSLVAWFSRRYPTALERLDASRRATQNALRLRELRPVKLR